MQRGPYNVMEEICRRHLPEIIRTRTGKCNCAQCQEDILAYALTRLPPRYVTTDKGAMYIMSEYSAVERSSIILKELLAAAEIVGNNPVHQTAAVRAADSEEAYQMLLRQIKTARGVDFSQYRDNLLKRRINVRLRSRNITTFSEYLQILQHEPDEYEALFDALTINVTSFFRDMTLWQILRQKIIPDIIERKVREGTRRMRIWSAGSASGAEAYSLAIVCFELLEKASERFSVEIIGTDIDRPVLEKARKGKYSREIIKNVSAPQLKRFFLPLGDEFMVVPHIKTMVQFEERNLVHDPILEHMDLVLCRNVFIYFNRSLQEHLIMQFNQALIPEGYFVMGATEILLGEARQLFKTVNMENKVYQKVLR